jgi:signal transduction histidine kinase
MGYIEKKEFELEMAKRDLEEQIEKLRKTQKSMYFMIEDLNEMSAQLKDARDNLEEKVRERTDELLNISRKLHRSERLAFLGKLSGSVTHELRNPLAVLKNAAYYFEKKFVDNKDKKVVKYIDIIKKEITIIDSIIDDIMGFAKTRAPELKENDVRDIADNAISSINIPELVEIKKEYADVPKILVDSDQVMHALMNLANNAIVAMKGNGTLKFRVFAEGNYVIIEVRDTGPGIPPEQRELIFEPLYSSKPKGTGLGLPIAKMMVENQEGKIEFDSELGEGTVFRISLPINRERRE